MRTHVAKVLVGTATANLSGFSVALSALTEGQIIVYDVDTGADVLATTKTIGFARGTATLGEPILSGPIPVAGIKDCFLNPYKAPVNKEMTLTVSAVPTVGKTVVIKVAYHDNLSIIPNQIKQTVIGIQATDANTASTTTWADAIVAAFNAQVDGGQIYVSVSNAANVITFVGLTLLTASEFNGIDRPEVLNFEIGAPVDEPDFGTYAVATTVALSGGQGTPPQVAWMETQAMGRQGFADRRLWNTKKYPFQVDNAETYDVLVINADDWKEGDMQGLRANPIGVVIACDGDDATAIITDLAVAGIVPTTIPAG